jgi:hypothetical protein
MTGWVREAVFMVLLACVLAVGCSDSALPAPMDVLSVKGPPSEVPVPSGGCPDFDASVFPADLSIPWAKTPALGTMPGAFSVSSTGEAQYTMRRRRPQSGCC